MENIDEKSVSFVNEEEQILYIKKEVIQGIGGKDYKLLDVKEKLMTSKANKPYKTYILILEDEYNRFIVDRLMRDQLKWFKRENPKMVHLTVEKVGAYLNWIVTPLD